MTGRALARQALAAIGIAPVPIPSGPQGEPRWPSGIVGSITHCAGYRACAVGHADSFAALGIDAERDVPLKDGVWETVAIAFDVGGSAITPFLGRSVALAGGFATIAARTGCWVLPIVPRRRGSRIDLHLLEPVDASALRDARSVRLRITQTFERVVLEAPHAVELAWYPSPLVTGVPPGELGPQTHLAEHSQAQIAPRHATPRLEVRTDWSQCIASRGAFSQPECPVRCVWGSSLAERLYCALWGSGALVLTCFSTQSRSR